jgi:hypothetical protein
MHILALIMTVVMIIHVRSKFTAVGEWRKHQARSARLTPNRAQGNHLVLLHLPPSHRCIAHSRRRRHRAGICSIPILRCRAERSRFGALHMSAD